MPWCSDQVGNENEATQRAWLSSGIRNQAFLAADEGAAVVLHTRMYKTIKVYLVFTL